MLDGDESPSVTTVLGAAGACPEIRHNGKTWKVGHPTGKAKAELEALAVAQAVSEVTSLKGIISPEEYAEMFGSLRDAITAKHYKTWGEGWQKIVWGPMSAHLFLLSLLRENHPDATEADVMGMAASAPEQVSAALAQVVPSFLLLLLAEIPHATPEQREKVMGVAEAMKHKLNPYQPPPAPTPATSVDSSRSGAKHSRKNRGVSIPSR